jgi:hypothetical protein
MDWKLEVVVVPVRDVAVSDIQVLDPRDSGRLVFFSDPDGNNWAVQEVKARVGATL